MKKQYFEPGCYVRDTSKDTFDRKIADKIIKEVLDRLETGAKKYGNGYLIGDLDREIRQELLDIIGWSILFAVRYELTKRKVLLDTDNIVWERFFRYQDISFLKKLQNMLNKEVKIRENNGSNKNLHKGK